MRALKILLATTALSLSTSALACPEDGGDHRFFAFAALLQSQREMPDRSGEQPAPQSDRNSSDRQDQPQPDPSANPGSSPTDATDAATFR